MDIPAYLRALTDIGFVGPLALDLYDGDYREISRKAVPILKEAFVKSFMKSYESGKRLPRTRD